MVKTQADGEDNQNADHLRPWIKPMDPGASVKVKEDVHSRLFKKLVVRLGSRFGIKSKGEGQT